MNITASVYRATQKFPAHELYGLSSQIRRAAVSIASNIAEGKGRSSDKELLQFLNRARGSSYELDTQLEIAQTLDYLEPEEWKELADDLAEVGRMLNGMIATIRQAVASSAA